MKTLDLYLTEMIQQAVQDAVEQALTDTLKKYGIGEQPVYLTAEKLSELTGWSRRTIQHMRDTRQIAFFQHGHKILYPRKELYAFLEAHTLARQNRR